MRHLILSYYSLNKKRDIIMKFSKLVLVVFFALGCLFLESAEAGDTTITWQVMSAGGTNASNTDYVLKGTLRQTSIGLGNSSSNINESGFWPYIWSLGPCCIGIRGNVNGRHEETVDILDHTFLVDKIFRGGPLPTCDEEADVNGDGGVADIIDLTYMTDLIFRGGPPPPACP